MPELPEVETVCKGLAPYLQDAVVKSVAVHHRKLRLPVPVGFEKQLQNAVIERLERRAKYILCYLDTGQVLLIHLGMSGSLVLSEEASRKRRTHDHIIIECVTASKTRMWLYFHDPRRFGLMILVPRATLWQHPLLTHLGAEPLEEKADGAYLYQAIHSSKAPIKSIIMDQKKLVGVGNIYACEALYRAHVSPERVANKVTKKEAHALMKAIKQVLTEAITSGGSTLRDYVRSSGDAGYFQHAFAVYGREDKPCMKCKSPVVRIVQAGRSSFYCPVCQK